MVREFVVTIKKDEPGRAKASGVEILTLLTTIAASVVIPIVLLIVGKNIENSIKSRELEVKYVELAVEILKDPPRPETAGLREWAIQNINRYADIKLADNVQEELKMESLPSASILETNPNLHHTVPATPREIKYVVVSDSEVPSLRALANVLTMPDTAGSLHYGIGLDGTILKLVEEENIAWHAGRSIWEGKPINERSIGIGLVHLSSSDGRNWLNLSPDNPAVGPEYTDAQIEALVELLSAILRRYDLKPENVITKQDLQPGRATTDLFGEPMQKIRERLARMAK